jgi:hypothetical protein
VSYGDIDAEYVTYAIDNDTIVYDATKAGGSASVGLAVKIVSNGTVALVADGEPIDGRLDSVEADGFARVQYGGFCQLPGGNSATLTAGLKAVGALNASSAKGYIRVVPETVTGAGPLAAEVTNAFRAARTKARIVDSSAATAVWVDLCC